MRKIAIIGLAPSTHDRAPFKGDWELWGLPWDTGHWHYYDRTFEMHDLDLLRDPKAKRPKGYEERLMDCRNLYMQKAYSEIPNAIRYPFEGVSETTGDYFNSSIAYMMAMAIHEEADIIGLWGVDMAHDEEYAYQKPNMEYLIGLAQGKGIDVYLPDESPLLKFNGEGIPLGDLTPYYPERYGVL